MALTNNEEQKKVIQPQQTQQATQTPASTGAEAATQQTKTRQQSYDEALNKFLGTDTTGLKTTSQDAKINDIMGRIMNRGAFAYDVNSDPTFQQYKQKYTEQGKMAMRDTMGQAAALTGGYGSSYGQSVGQQQYDAYLQQLNDVIPELQQNAYDRYQDEGNQLTTQYGMLTDAADTEYNRNQDAYNAALQKLGLLQGEANTEYDRQGDSYSKLMSLVQMGYQPTSEDAAAAGLTDDQMAAIVSKYAPKKAVYSTPKTADTQTGSRVDRYVESLIEPYTTQPTGTKINWIKRQLAEDNIGTSEAAYMCERFGIPTSAVLGSSSSSSAASNTGKK